MASTGDDGGLEARSVENDSSSNSSVVPGEEAQHNPLNAAPPDHAHSDSDKGTQDEDSSDDDRENRFQGPSSTWRFFTEEERTLAHSLDQQRANDLSIHSYNVHALKARSRDPNATKVEHHRSKKRWIKSDQNGDLPWQPPNRWTAWPLLPENVPRNGEKFGVSAIPDGFDSTTYKKAGPWRPSGELREEILAVAMRKAKDRLRANETLAAKHVSNGGEEESTDQDVQMSGALPSDVDVSMRDDDETAPSSVSEKRRRIRQIMPQPASFLPDSILIDDDQARTLLRSKINHDLSQLDGLLVGLQKSRQGQVRTSSRPQSRSGRSESASRPAKPASRSKSRRKNANHNDEDDKKGVADAADADDGYASNGNNPRRRRKLNPRDWSEVLGMAALIGWDPKVIDGAAQRCTALFGESMDFRTITLKSMKTTESKLRTHGECVGADSAALADGDFIIDDTSKTKLPVCPAQTCARHEVPFDKAWRWREHLKRSHKYSNSRIEMLEEELDSGAAKFQGLASAFDTGQTSIDPVLRPVEVKMGRGKDKAPRKRKASQSEPIVIEDDKDTDEPIEIDSDSDSDPESDEDTDMEEEE